MADVSNIGEAVAAFLEQTPVAAVFGVISIHNMPILDALHRRRSMRFVPARGEAGAVAMADACARVSGGLGVAITSTGTAAGNAAGAMVEALTAGTPLLHITGQIERPYLDRDLGYIHEARDQLGMLRAVSKRAYRIASAKDVPLIGEAIQLALTAPTGPVSIEIPIDLQQASYPGPEPRLPALQAPDVPTIDALAEKLSTARRPLLWLGGGARHAAEPVRALLRKGFGVVTSVQGRGIVPEDHPMTLGAFNIAAPVEKFYSTCDAILVAGSRLRSNETLGYRLRLPQPLYRIDIEASRAQHPYEPDLFIQGDVRQVLERLAVRLDLSVDPAFAGELKSAKDEAVRQAREALGPYQGLVDALTRFAGREFIWVRDVTVSNSTWGNRLLSIFGPRNGVHALGGGIGMGLPMAIGAAAGSARRVVALCGDGGFALNMGELGTAVQENSDFVLVLMNDFGYGVIRNIQDAQYGGRRAYVDLATPDFAKLASAYHGLRYAKVSSTGEFRPVLEKMFAEHGPAIVEVDMHAIGPYPTPFAGPPKR